MYFLQLTGNRKGTLLPPPLKTPLLGPGRDLSSKNDLVEHCIASSALFPTPLKVSLPRLVPVIPIQLLNFISVCLMGKESFPVETNNSNLRRLPFFIHVIAEASLERFLLN